MKKSQFLLLILFAFSVTSCQDGGGSASGSAAASLLLDEEQMTFNVKLESIDITLPISGNSVTVTKNTVTVKNDPDYPLNSRP